MTPECANQYPSQKHASRQNDELKTASAKCTTIAVHFFIKPVTDVAVLPYTRAMKQETKAYLVAP